MEQCRSLRLALAAGLVVFSGCTTQIQSRVAPAPSPQSGTQQQSQPTASPTPSPTPIASVAPSPSPSPTPTGAPSSSGSWIQQLGTNGSETYAYGLASDSTNAVYVTGATSGALHGNTQAGDFDLFAAKYDVTGKLLWTKQLGTSASTTEGTAAALDHAGHLYVTGYTTGALKTDREASTSLDTEDVVVAQYDATTGALLWVKQIGANAVSVSQGIAVDSNNQIYIAGYTTGALPNNIQSGNQDLFLAKLDSKGNLLWVRQIGTPDQYAYAYRIAVDSSNHVYFTGYTTAGLGNILQEAHDAAFVAKYDSDGNQNWLHELDSTTANTSIFSYGIVVDGSNNVYLAGSTNSPLAGNTQGGIEDLFLAKYDSSGSFAWVKQLGSSDGHCSAHDVAIDGMGHLYVVGTTTTGLSSSTQNGTQDFFVAKYDLSGTLLNVRQMGSKAGLSSAFGVAVDNANDVYVGGFTAQPLAGNTQTGAVDFFTAKFSPN
jgi:hypothetical protein